MKNQTIAYSGQAWESCYGMIQCRIPHNHSPIVHYWWPLTCITISMWSEELLTSLGVVDCKVTSCYQPLINPPPPLPAIVKLNSVTHQYSPHFWTVTCYQWLVMSCVIRQTNYCHIVLKGLCLWIDRYSIISSPIMNLELPDV